VGGTTTLSIPFFTEAGSTLVSFEKLTGTWGGRLTGTMGRGLTGTCGGRLIGTSGGGLTEAGEGEGTTILSIPLCKSAIAGGVISGGGNPAARQLGPLVTIVLTPSSALPSSTIQLGSLWGRQ
jgi:hypothetical protein